MARLPWRSRVGRLWCSYRDTRLRAIYRNTMQLRRVYSLCATPLTPGAWSPQPGVFLAAAWPHAAHNRQHRSNFCSRASTFTTDSIGFLRALGM